MMQDTDARAITIGEPEEVPAPNRMQDFRRKAGCCVRVAPWVSAISCIMVAVGLAVWYIYTKRALSLTQDLSQQLFNERLYLVQKLTEVIGWILLIMVIVVSCLLGITMLIAMLRTYQDSARLPHTTCGSPSKLSYGSYAGLIAFLNFLWWLLALTVALLIAGNLVWLTIAFLFESALWMGVTYTPNTGLAPTAYYRATRNAVDGLSTYASLVQPQLPAAVASQQEVQNMNRNIQQFLTTARDVPVVVCPVNCLNMGSFYDALHLTTSCVCTDTSIADLRNMASSLWQDLVHVLAALALMGLGCLWHLMNMSANFAHARRDMAEVPSRKYQQFISGDAIAAVHTLPAISPSKKSGTRTSPRDQDAGHNLDTNYGNEFTSTTAPGPVSEPTATPEHMTYNSAYDTYQDSMATPLTGEPSATPQRRTSSPTGRNETEQPSPNNTGRGATFNTTAQRYAAYRLRAAQAAAAKGSPSSEGGRKQWVR